MWAKWLHHPLLFRGPTCGQCFCSTRFDSIGKQKHQQKRFNHTCSAKILPEYFGGNNAFLNPVLTPLPGALLMATEFDSKYDSFTWGVIHPEPGLLPPPPPQNESHRVAQQKMREALRYRNGGGGGGGQRAPFLLR